ncbi:RidA family protein [Amnibacterium kyonggiense]
MSAHVRLVEPAGLPTAVPYAYAAVVAAGARLVLLSGACPLDAAGRTVAPGDVPGQAAVCVENMLVALAAAGAAPEDVAFVRVLVASTSRDDLAAAWEVVHRAFDPHEPPGTLQGVTVLGWPDQLVEVEVVAAIQEALAALVTPPGGAVQQSLVQHEEASVHPSSSGPEREPA